MASVFEKRINPASISRTLEVSSITRLCACYGIDVFQITQSCCFDHVFAQFLLPFPAICTTFAAPCLFTGTLIPWPPVIGGAQSAPPPQPGSHARPGAVGPGSTPVSLALGRAAAQGLARRLFYDAHSIILLQNIQPCFEQLDLLFGLFELHLQDLDLLLGCRYWGRFFRGHRRT